MKLFIIAGLVLLSGTRGCVDDDSEQDWETETNTIGYDAADTAVRQTTADWDHFLEESYSAVDAACIRISQANDRADDHDIKHKGKLRSAIIHAEERMEKLSDMLLNARKIEQRDFHFDASTIEDIASFKKEFKMHQDKMDDALTAMELLVKE